MKRLCTILSLIIFALSVNAQSNVFVLVDVSKSVSQADLNNAKQALTEVLAGSPLSKAFVPKDMGKQQDLVNFKTVQGDKLAIAKFGSLQTTLAINPNPTTIQNTNADVNQILNSTAWTPTDQQTYLTLAKAKIAEYAKNHNITSYKLYVISDNINDDYGQGGQPNYPDAYTRNLVQGYNTSINPVGEAGYTILKFNANSLFTLKFSPDVDISKYNLPGVIPPTVIDANTGNAIITLTSPSKVGKSQEHEIKTETLNVNWTCQNCPQGIKYNVLVSQYDGGKFREIKRKLTSNTATFKLPDGKFRISVSSSNFPALSDYTYVSVHTGGYGFIAFLLVLIAAAAVGYYFWNKARQEKINIAGSNNGEDIFSKGGKGTTGNLPNTDYF